MKKMRQYLSVLLAVAMAFSMGISTFAFDDVKDGTKVSEAVGILNNLGIIEGFEDGTFRPEDSVTRAQMAAIICRTLGYEDQAEGSAGSTAFTDVSSSHWASGYINVAQSLGIINGYGNGKFGPDDKVKYEQAVKMIVVALGYELDAQSKGGWPNGYLAVASREGITKNSGGSIGSPADRGTIAVLVYNSLEVRLMDQKSWTTNGSDEYGKTDETILSQYLEVEKWEGIVTSAPYYDYAQHGYEEDADQFMSLGNAFYTEYQNGKLVKEDGVISNVDCSLVQDVNTLVGKKVIAYIGAEEDDDTGNRMVYAIAEKQGANKVTKISAVQLVESGERYYNSAKTIGYREVGSSRINTLDLDANVEVIVNFGATKAGTVSTTQQLETLFEDAGGTIEFISNDADSKADYIIATVYDEEAVIEEVNQYDEMISFNTYTGNIEEIDTEDEDSLVVVIRDGKIASVNDIEENDTVSIVGSNDFARGFRVLYVSGKVVAGYVGAYYDNVVIINDDEYEISPFMGASPSDLSGEEGIFFLNVDNQIAWSDSSSASAGNYGVVIATGKSTGLRGGYEVEIVFADGSVAQYPLNSKAYIEATDGTDSVKSDSATYEALKSGMSANSSAYRVKAENLQNYIFEVSVKNNKVTKLTKLVKGATPSGKRYDEENMCYGTASFDDSTVVFSVKVNGSTLVESNDISVGDVTDFFVDGEGEKASLIAFDENSRDIAGVVLGYGLSDSIPQDADAFIITGVKNSTYSDYDAYVVTGMQGGKLISYTICDEDEGYTGDEKDLQKGNVILLGVQNSRGIVTDFQTLYSVSGGVKASDSTIDDIYYIAGNLDEDTAPTDNKFFLIDNSRLQGNYYDTSNGISMRNSANYTLVDYSESTKNPEVSRKSKSKSIFGTLFKYDSVVFVRYYDDELRDVVVYRYNNGTVEIPPVNTTPPAEPQEPEQPKVVAVPTATPGSGEVQKDSTVALTAEAGAVIYYTTDGNVPTTESAVYSAPIAITANVTIKAMAVLDGISSEVGVFEFTIPAETPVKTEAPVETPVKTEAPAETPVKTETPAETPVKTEAPVETPAKTEAPAETPVKTETPVETPAKTEAPAETPVKTEAPAETPAKTEAPAETPVKTETPAETPVKTEAPAETPVKTEAPVETPAKTEVPAETPVKTEAPAEAPAKTETPAVDTSKTEAKLPAALEKKVELKVPVIADKKADAKISAVPQLKIDPSLVQKAPNLKLAEELKKGVVSSAPALTLVKTNINKATAAELAKLEGITEAIAAKIVDYRVKNGEFKAIEDLKKVDGVTDAVYDKIKANLTV